MDKESNDKTVRQQISRETYLRVNQAWASEGGKGTVTEYLEECVNRGLPKSFRKATK